MALPLASIRARLDKIEQRHRIRVPGIHRYTDDELADLIAWLREPDWSREEWAAGLLRREALIR